MAEVLGLRVPVVLQPHALEDLQNFFVLLLADRSAKKLPHLAAARQGELHVLERCQAVVHARCLEFAADAAQGDVGLERVRDVVALEKHRAGRRAGLAADEVAQRRFAGAVRTDDHTQLVALDAPSIDVHRLEAVEHGGQILDEQEKIARADPVDPRTKFPVFGNEFGRVHASEVRLAKRLKRIKSSRPAMPFGNSNTTPTNSNPCTNGQTTGAWVVRKL